MSTSKNIFTQQRPELIRLFAHAGSPEKVLCVPMDYAKEKHVALCCNGLGMILKQSFPVDNTPEGVEYLLTVLENIRKKHFITKDHVVLGGEDCGTFTDNFIHALTDQLFPGFLRPEKSGIPAFGEACLELMGEAFSPKQVARRQLKSLADQSRLLIALREAILRSERSIGCEFAKHAGAWQRRYAARELC